MATLEIVGFIGLDELSLELASSLIRLGFRVQGFEEKNGGFLDEFLLLGGVRCDNLMDVVRGATTLFVVTEFGGNSNLPLGDNGLHSDVVVILQSTLSPSYINKLQKSLTGEFDGAALVGAHIFKGVSGSFNGKIIVVAFGNHSAIQKAQPVLSAISAKLHALEGEIDGASKIRMVNELLEGIHLVASVEAMYLGVRAGIHPSILYDIISNAAGSSWVFANMVPKLLAYDESLANSLDSLVNDLGPVMGTAKQLTFPLPLLSMAYQQLIHGSSHACKDNHVASPIKVWNSSFGINITESANEKSYNPGALADQLSSSAIAVKRIGFIGLGAMGFGMATHLLRSNYCVRAYDVYKPTLSRFQDLGGLIGASPAEVCKDVEVLIVMVANETQAESVLFGEAGSVAALPAGASVMLSSTVSPAYVKHLDQRLEDQQKSLKLVDAPVSGGVKRAADGTLTIMASGADEALASTVSVLSALSEKLYVIKGGCGAASSVKMVNQLLAGVHIAAAAEAMAFGARLGLNTRMLFEIINNERGFSWMFENRVPHMLDNDYTPYSAIDIFVKDLGIVSAESSLLKLPLPIASAAHQLFVSGSASGWGRYDDAAVVKVYETLTGVKVEGKLSVRNKENILKSLPPEWPENPIDDLHTKEHQIGSKVLVVLDDDPTGTQTVHDIEVLTQWNVEALIEQFCKNPVCFFILTNSRSLSSEKAALLTKDICQNLDIAAQRVKGIKYTVVLRGDSTLRGHFPEEADAVVSILGEMDAWIICPFFLQGGRYTIDDIHYVADSDSLVPAGETEFSKDASFGYKSSNLREWVEEKTKGRIAASSVVSISIPLLRTGGPTAVCDLLCSLQKGSTCIVNAASERDMVVFAAGMIQAERKGKRFLCRTAASFVSARIGIKPKPPMRPSDLGLNRNVTGGLIVVGSYVPKTTKQVEELKSQLGHILQGVEISVEKVAMKSEEDREEEISQAAEMANTLLSLHRDTLLMTSRKLITGKTPSESLEINYKVSSALVDIVRRINVRPHYILAKGGITSSDIATKALEAKCAKVIGQALAGVPLWQLGPESRHPGVPYIVFPGNVGDNNALADVVKTWARPSRLSTKDLLLNAEKGGYAVGAFNVYNLEGIEAVVAAAEAENSPAILQVHPGAMKYGGLPLIACCISAAEQATVPITVHFDHGSSKSELVEALELGFDSVMVDGSHLSLMENISYTKYISVLAHSKGMLVEAELGRLSGTEDNLTVEDYEAKLTDACQAQEFIDKTGIDALAVCIGNVHGTYPASGPNLRLNLLEDLRTVTLNRGVSLVLHGASGLSKELVKECIGLGVRKFNVNTEVRNAYLEAVRKPNKDLVHVMTAAKEAMKAVVAEKMHLFGSAGKA
ncbi:Fructose-bisphosphate aldolase protein [Dioscorea alata]|uniref:Fructose-bisphosphate aldolase protein n=1 Tax=Dioscorea alata TaxID=55571 RepID=A0ACB7VYM7_DIOAL|nr:Fructose-bisphosphate aldolase protein [Dioscorea alata]